MSSPLITRLLASRGIPETGQEAFLNPDFQRDTYDPMLMKGMEAAVVRMGRAIGSKESIAIFGDYDADGVPATAVMVRALRGLGVVSIPLIPTRASGYGLTMETVETLKATGVSLLVTVDNGTVAKEEVAALKRAGIDTIVCDHHEPQDDHIADAAVAILNPKQADCPYPFKELCGCAIAWKLVMALYAYLDKDTGPLKWELDLVALSTIADMVPLVGENRVLVKYGMKVLHKSRNRGLQALAAVAGQNLESISSGSVGFHLAPRINAPSRMHQELENGEHVGLRLLTTDDTVEAYRLAEYLNERNRERQSLVDVHLEEAESLVQACLHDRCLVLYGKNWSTGVIGLVAGRMVEKYKRPAIALAQEGLAIKGSVRSVDGVHALSFLDAAAEVMERYGGHAKAAGLTLKDDTDPETFRTLVNQWFEVGTWTLETLRTASERKADAEIALSEVTLETADELKQLEPYGIGFPTPVFSSVCRLKGVRRVGGQGKHLSCLLDDGTAEKKAIGFRLGETKIEEDAQYRVFYTIEKEEWNNRVSPSCVIQRLDML